MFIIQKLFVETHPEFVAMYCALLWFFAITLWTGLVKGRAQYWDAKKWAWSVTDKAKEPMYFWVTICTHISLCLIVLYLWWQN